MIEQHAERWTVEWLRARGLHDWAEYLHRLNSHVEKPTDAILNVNGIPPLHTNGKIHYEEMHQ
jgi:hypothetical protein